VKPGGLPAEDLDEESASWLRRLRAADREQHAAEGELHARLVRIALAEVRRRQARTAVTGAMAALHVYAELAAAGQDPADAYPGIAAHLAACGPCGENFAGLLAVVTGGQSS